MDKETAWLNFVNTGSVSDYLEYTKIKHRSMDYHLEEATNADKDRRIGYNGENRR